jgi:hypothetical protein
MKRLVLTFLSAGAVCAVVSDNPAAAQDTIRGAPSARAPVTVEGYGASIAPQTLSSLIARVFVVGTPTSLGAPDRLLPQSARLRADVPPQSPDPERGNSEGSYRGVP